MGCKQATGMRRNVPAAQHPQIVYTNNPVKSLEDRARLISVCWKTSGDRDKKEAENGSARNKAATVPALRSAPFYPTGPAE